jgi:hypothetical protein
MPIVGYPMRDMSFRWGLQWIFIINQAEALFIRFQNY